ncbi:MAG: hypothetical protein MR717_01495 [Prevotella sp.]|nr:hypothetical protein [Prevotella sp.]
MLQSQVSRLATVLYIAPSPVLSGVAVSNIVRFEQKGLISLKNLIGIAMALGYTSELRHIFGQPKYSTMDELLQIRKNTGKKKAHRI